MSFQFAHNEFHVLDLERSLKFYEEALGFRLDRKYEGPDFTLAYLKDGEDSPHRLELTWNHGRKEPYDLGENEFHLALTTDDYEAAHKKHQEMGCISFENPGMGLYFIQDPDGYWIEILPR